MIDRLPFHCGILANVKGWLMFVPAEIYRSEPERRRECLYFLAVGHFKLGNYPEAKRYNSKFILRSLKTYPKFELMEGSTNDLPGLLLEKEPNNFQSQSLKALIEQAVAKGALVQVFI